jgi:hypothetical protein
MTPKSNNSQHQMTREQAADNVRGSYAVLWSSAYGQALRDGTAEPLFTPQTFASSGGEPSEDI